MRIGIDCDGVLRDLITCITDTVKETHPQHADKILTPTSWDWDQWLPFWTNDETEKYIFEDNYLDFFGVECPPIKSAVEDWNKLRAWAIENGHKLILVSAQRPHCIEPTEDWLKQIAVPFFTLSFSNLPNLSGLSSINTSTSTKCLFFSKCISSNPTNPQRCNQCSVGSIQCGR